MNATTAPSTVPCTEYLDDRSAAHLLGLKPKTIITWRKTAGLPHFVVGSRVVRIRKTDLEEWLAKHRVSRVRLPKVSSVA